MKFKRLYLEITNRCNLSCRFCRPHHRPARSLSPEEFSMILRQAKPYVDQLYLHLKGEPLLHPQLSTLLDICAKENFPVNLTTNGTLLAQQQAMLLAKPALRQVNISVHSFDEQSTSQQARYIHELLIFAEKAAASGRYISLRFWNQKTRQPTPDASDNLSRIIKHFAKDDNSPLPLNQLRSTALSERIFLSFDEPFEWPDLTQSPLSNIGTCYGLRTQLGILSDGTVVPCCLDGDGINALGNILTTPLTDILSNPHCQKIRNHFQQNKITLPLCQRCSYRTRFDK